MNLPLTLWLCTYALAFAPQCLAQAAGYLRSPALNELNRCVLAGVPNAEEQFFSSLITPIIEPLSMGDGWRLVTFIWRGDVSTERVTVLGGRPVTDFDAPLEKLPGTQIWYRTEILPSDSRFAYFITVNPPAETPDDIAGLLNAPKPVKDPYNPNKIDETSYVVLPNALPFPYKSDLISPKGQLVNDSLASAILSSDIRLRIYLPANHDRKNTRPWLLIAFDGGFHDMATVLDDLIATGKTPPLIVVGVVNRDGMRKKDLGYSETFARFVAEELLPWAQKRFHASRRRAHTILAGASRGGGMAAFVALRYPRAFSKVLCLSTAIENEPGGSPPTRFWLRGDDGWIIERYLEATRQPLRFYLSVGRFDTSLWTDRLVNNRRFRDMLRGKGYRVDYAESNGGHDELFFQRGYIEGLIALTNRR